jgi:uncharacterized protein YecE (DUF72 family)
MSEASGRLWIGTSGWVYAHWRGVFYPQEMPTSKWLPYYADQFSTVELNNSFYRLPSEAAFRGWTAGTRPGFRFSVKASRYLTHMKKLRDPQEPLERFLGRARLLGEKLGPVLYQLPPRWRCNLSRLRGFLACLPADLDHVLEFRDPSWINDQVFAALEAHSVGFCTISHPTLTCPIQPTSDIAYIRMHGAEKLYASCYSEGELRWWAGQIEDVLSKGHEVYVYFNNDAYGYAVQNAQRLRELLQTGVYLDLGAARPG